MMHTTKHRRLQLAVTGLITVVGGLFLAATAVPSAAQLPDDPVPAHHAILDGTPSCPGPDHVINWSIGNSQKKEDMTILSAAAVLNGSTYAVIGFTNPVPAGGTTTAATTIPGALTGIVTITVKSHWSDNHTRTNTANVALPDPCPNTTTTEPPTTEPPTTQPPVTVKPTVPPTQPPYVGPPTSECRGTVQPDGSCKLAFTGPWEIVGLTAAGFGVLILGIALIAVPADPRRKLRRA